MSVRVYLLFLVFQLAASVSVSQRCGFVTPEREVTALPFSGPLSDEIVIPVVVHIVWQEPEENIPDERVWSQIEALNEAFGAQHIPDWMAQSVFSPYITDTKIRFCLATRDPQGLPTTGIERRHTNSNIALGGTTELHYTSMGGLDAWDPQRYLNIWVTRFAGGITGTASFPEQGPAAEDGVEVHYAFFGKDATVPYDQGITTVHEVGHYLGLPHPWGPDAPTCNQDDGIDDTPLSELTYQGECPTWLVFSCGTPDMSMNFMYYTNDACMALFTPQQRDLMWATLNGPRSTLKDSDGCVFTPVSTDTPNEGIGVRLYPNPNDGVLSVQWDYPDQMTLEWYDLHGRCVKRLSANGTTARIHHRLPSGTYLFQLKDSQGKVIDRRLCSVVR